MTIEKLIEDALITDFKLDSVLAAQLIRNHDYDGAIAGDDQLTDQEALSVIVVTALDQGDFQIGSGIRKVNVEVLIRANGEVDGFTGEVLEDLAGRVAMRIQPSPTVSAPGRESHLSTSQVLILGLTNNSPTDRTETGLERQRTIRTEIIAAQLA